MTEFQSPGLEAGPSPDPAFDYRDVVDALERAVIVTSLEGTILSWNAAAERMYGWTESEARGRNTRDVLVPVTSYAEADDIVERLRRGETWQGDFSVLHRDGRIIRVAVIDSPIRDASGNVVAIVGVSEDVTEQRLEAHRTRQLADHLALALEAGGMGTWRWDIATGETVWDAKLEELFGLEPGEFDGTFDAYMAMLHPDDRDEVLATVDQAVEEQRSYVVEHRVVWPDGSVRWVQGKGTVIIGESGDVLGTMGCVADVTEQMQAADRERLGAERLEFIGQINDVLARSATRDDVMRNVAAAAVPAMGDLCGIYVLPSPNSDVPDAAFAHADERVAAYIDRIRDSALFHRASNTAVAHAIRTGEPMFLPDVDEAVFEQYGTPAEVRELAAQFGFTSAIAVPLIKNQRIIGALQFVNTDTSRAYTPADLALAQAIASRVASTLENRRLADLQREIAMTLQASLLPSMLPEIPNIDIAVRYWASGEGTAVGGDFYDVFELGERRWAAVIGDVCGTGPAAAALTGLARHTIRASAWHGATPDEVLKNLNFAILRCGQRTFCTALYCELSESPDEALTFTVAAGGHPLPLLGRAGEKCRTLGEPGTLLGLFEGSRSSTVSADLQPGDVVVLYTDGITDLPPPHALDADDVCGLIDESADGAASADELAGRLGQLLEQRLPFTERNDDIALLVMRVR